MAVWCCLQSESQFRFNCKKKIKKYTNKWLNVKAVGVGHLLMHAISLEFVLETIHKIYIVLNLSTWTINQQNPACWFLVFLEDWQPGTTMQKGCILKSQIHVLTFGHMHWLLYIKINLEHSGYFFRNERLAAGWWCDHWPHQEIRTVQNSSGSQQQPEGRWPRN